MKKIFIIAALSFTLLLSFRCQQQQKNQIKNKKTQNNLDNNKFPDYLVGTWLATTKDKEKWIFTFEPEGTISKFKHFVGMEFVVADRERVDQLRDGVEARYLLGPCTAIYNEKTRELNVTVIIESYEVKFKTGSIKGNFYDYIIGYISEDGQTWNAEWIDQNEIFGSGKSEFDKPQAIVFKKVTEDVYN